MPHDWWNQPGFQWYRDWWETYGPGSEGAVWADAWPYAGHDEPDVPGSMAFEPAEMGSFGESLGVRRQKLGDPGANFGMEPRSPRSV